jgi:hypothetical protein
MNNYFRKNFVQFSKFSPRSKIFLTYNRLFNINKPSLTIFNSNRKNFSDYLLKLNVDKLSLSKLDDKPISISTADNEEKDFDKDKYIIEYGPEIKWEEDVLKSELPVVVDCYAV